jgi:hypothetical protein
MKLNNQALSESVKRTAASEHLVQKRKVKKFYTTIKKLTHNCREHDDVLFLSLDFLQNVTLSHISVSEIFYLR